MFFLHFFEIGERRLLTQKVKILFVIFNTPQRGGLRICHDWLVSAVWCQKIWASLRPLFDRLDLSLSKTCHLLICPVSIHSYKTFKLQFLAHMVVRVMMQEGDFRFLVVDLFLRLSTFHSTS